MGGCCSNFGPIALPMYLPPMHFRTQLIPSPSNPQISYQSNILSMGSCFADRMGERLQQAKFNTQVNPLGIAYNPISLGDLLLMALGEKPVPTAHFSQSEEVWQSLAFHSSFNHPNEEQFELGIQSALSKTRSWLEETDVLILTFGTAWVYRRKDNQEIVNNCHRFPSSFFTKELLTTEIIQTELTALFSKLWSLNPSLRILLTVSPIRHIKDGMERNSVSKATLRLACHQLVSSHEQIAYFPAFELMMDDLRDYRFYQEDLLHPTELAEAYIWEKFVLTHFSASTQNTLQQWNQLQKDLTHRPRNPHSEGHRRFLEKLLGKLAAISGEVDCGEEMQQVKQLLGTGKG